MSAIALIVGLGNPGPRYQATRHNVGAWWVERLAAEYQGSWQTESKFRGVYCKISIQQQDVMLFLPSTYMNESGSAVGLLCRYYQYSPTKIVIAHDELDLPAGVVRLKRGGGHGGHNGLRDIVEHLGSNAFNRLRIGIGHPGDRTQVTDYVLSPPNRADKQMIEDGLQRADAVLDDLVQGHFDRAMRQLHTDEEK